MPTQIIYALVKFEFPHSAEQASETLIHRVCDKKTAVQKSALSNPIKNENQKLFVEGFQMDTDPEKVRVYFEKFGKLEHINKTAFHPTGKMFVVFKSKISLHHVLRQNRHVLDGCSLRIRPVLWRNLTNESILMYLTESVSEWNLITLKMGSCSTFYCLHYRVHFSYYSLLPWKVQHFNLPLAGNSNALAHKLNKI